MRNTVIFSDWTSVDQIINSIDPKIKAEGSAIVRTTDTSQNEIAGYDLTVYLQNPYRVLYKVKVDMDQEGVWSIPTEEAVEFLNTVGFVCDYQLPPYYGIISEENQEVLRSLINLGYSHVIRTFSEGRGKVEAIRIDKLNDSFNFRKLSNYNYLDWIFLRLNDATMISSLLKS